jgi:phosphate-selective porin
MLRSTVHPQFRLAVQPCAGLKTQGDPMMKVVPHAAAAAVAFSLMLAGSAFAQSTATPAPAAPAAKTAPAKMSKTKSERTAASLECSTQADAKGLHGKERKKFRSECKKGATKAN